MNKILKGLLLCAIIVVALYYINYLLEYVFNLTVEYNLAVRLIAVLILQIILTVILSTIAYYYCGRNYKMLMYSSTVVLIFCLYYILFVYGFSWLSVFQILIPLCYVGGIKNVLKDNLGYQMRKSNSIATNKKNTKV